MMIPNSSHTRFSGIYSLQGQSPKQIQSAKNFLEHRGIQYWQIQLSKKNDNGDQYLTVNDKLGNHANRAYGKFMQNKQFLAEPKNQNAEDRRRLFDNLNGFYKFLIGEAGVHQLNAMFGIVRSMRTRLPKPWIENHGVPATVEPHKQEKTSEGEPA